MLEFVVYLIINLVLTALFVSSACVAADATTSPAWVDHARSVLRQNGIEPSRNPDKVAEQVLANAADLKGYSFDSHWDHELKGELFRKGLAALLIFLVGALYFTRLIVQHPHWSQKSYETSLEKAMQGAAEHLNRTNQYQNNLEQGL